MDPAVPVSGTTFAIAGRILGLADGATDAGLTTGTPASMEKDKPETAAEVARSRAALVLHQAADAEKAERAQKEKEKDKYKKEAAKVCEKKRSQFLAQREAEGKSVRQYTRRTR